MTYMSQPVPQAAVYILRHGDRTGENLNDMGRARADRAGITLDNMLRHYAQNGSSFTVEMGHSEKERTQETAGIMNRHCHANLVLESRLNPLNLKGTPYNISKQGEEAVYDALKRDKSPIIADAASKDASLVLDKLADGSIYIAVGHNIVEACLLHEIAKEKSWVSDKLPDYLQGYAIKKEDGKLYLYQVNMETGAEVRVCEVEKGSLEKIRKNEDNKKGSEENAKAAENNAESTETPSAESS